jgi:hypothetical protein
MSCLAAAGSIELMPTEIGRRVAPISIFFIAIAVLVVTLGRGAFVAGGADSYGYLSQARLWEHGWPISFDPMIREVPWPFADWTFSPLGYRPGVLRGTIVPIYSAGYPLLMAAAGRSLGTRAELYVVPLTAAGLVICTGVMGTWLGGPEQGALSSLFMATSPVFVVQSLQPMSDIPAAFWWTLAAVLGLYRQLFAGLVAGLAVMMAVLTRPNLFPLGVALAVFVLVAKRNGDERYNWFGALAILTGLAAGGGMTAYLNTMYYGSPTISGYGAPRDLYGLSYLPINLARYSAWVVQTEAPALVAAAAGFIAFWSATTLSRRWACYAMTVFAILSASYLFYKPFENWTYLRFFLPVYPLLFVAVLGVTRLHAVARTPRTRIAVMSALTLIIVAVHLQFISSSRLFKTIDDEARYVKVAEYIRRTLPVNAVMISLQHSGSIRYYSGRRTLRFDWVQPNWLDEAVVALQRLGYKPYLLLESWEEPLVRDRFAASSAVGKLDWSPAAEFPPYRIRLYDPADRLKIPAVLR